MMPGDLGLHLQAPTGCLGIFSEVFDRHLIESIIHPVSCTTL